jgi:hypothetical protein
MLEGIVCVGSDGEVGLTSMLRDPLIRLMMHSDGVTERAMLALVEQVRRSLAARKRPKGSVPALTSAGSPAA